jgi:hypothetical protein
VQVVGQSCAVCGARIVAAPDGRACASCAVALHNGCAAGHTCAAAGKPAPATAVAPAGARSRRGRLGTLLLVVLVSSAVVPRVRTWRTERRVARHLAPRLGCAASEIEIEQRASGITARGCGRTVQLLRVCGQIDRPECLQEIELVPQR